MIDIEQIEQGGGNAKLPPRKQCPYWKCNYHLKEGETIPIIFEQIERVFEQLCLSYIFSEELGSSGKTLHIEGYMIFEKKIDFNVIQKLFKFSDLQASKKCNSLAGIKYCLKEGLRNIHKNIKIPKPLIKMTYDKLREEQKQIADLFTEDEDPLFGRKIYWFWETAGCWGKSILATYMIDQMDAFECAGKGNDIFCGITSYIEANDEGPGIIIYDVPRSNLKYINYGALEKVKDGKFFSGKYESKPVRFNRPHIICLANEPPNLDGVSLDRWIVKKLVKCDCPPMRNRQSVENLIICPKCGT